jgi:hypothetical protein
LLPQLQQLPQSGQLIRFDEAFKLSAVERRNGNLCAVALAHLSNFCLWNSDSHLYRVQIDNGDNRDSGSDRKSDIDLAHSNECPKSGRATVNQKAAFGPLIFSRLQQLLCRFR